MKNGKGGGLIWENGLDPFENLALEETIFEMDLDCVRMWQNRPAVIVGRNQNTLREVSEIYLQEQEIALARRMTGGGAVYHDLGNLNVSFFFHWEDFDSQVREKIEWIVDFLRSMGARAFLNGRNDICVKSSDGAVRKVSGWAMMQREQRGMLHGTLLFSTDFEAMEHALTPPAVKLESKGIASVRSRVANLRDYGELFLLDMEGFASRLAAYLRQRGYRDMELPEDCKERQKELVAGKYKSEGWIYGCNPGYSVYNQMRFPIGTVEVNLDLRQNRIERCVFSGDYMNRESLMKMAACLKGISYTRSAISDVLKEVDCRACLGTGDMELLLRFFKEGE